MKLDSIINEYYIADSDSFIKTGKYEFGYNSNGKQTLESWFNWKSDIDSWEMRDQWEYNYNSNNYLVQNTYLHWSNDSSKLIPYSRQVFDYDSEGNKILDASLKYDVYYTQDWIGENKTEYEYDSNGNKFYEKFFGWDSTKKDWVEKSSNEYNYNSLGSITLQIQYRWDSSNNTWKNEFKYVNAYDNDNNLISEESYEWSYLNNDWDWVLRKMYKYEYEFSDTLNTTTKLSQNLETGDWKNYQKTALHKSTVNQSDNQITEIYYNWNNTIDDWLGASKGIYIYDSQNFIIDREGYSWNNDSNRWKGNSKYEYIRDENENYNLVTYYKWDKTSNNWYKKSKLETGINNSWNYTDLILPNHNLEVSILSPWQGFLNYNKFQNMLTQITFYDFDDSENDLIQGPRSTLYYSGQTLDKTNKLANPFIRIYPNPANNYIYISNINKPAHFELFTMNGKKVMMNKLAGNAQIQVSHLKPGMYFYRLNMNDKIQTGKIIIQ
ncbi:MAG TPA: T9SS type A sorting domain-containing protein [Draconibacterium sp.]|nr:T9SS type A sorting domain-containing protein [Draconibacterium sp.]